MRLLLLLVVAGAAAYFTVPTRAAHEEAARVYLQGYQPAAAAGEGGLSIEQLVGYAKGLLAGQGRYENYYVVSRYSVDMPGAAYLECYGAYTLVRCSEAGG
jgi:hypothetical protein